MLIFLLIALTTERRASTVPPIAGTKAETSPFEALAQRYEDADAPRSVGLLRARNAATPRHPSPRQ